MTETCEACGQVLPPQLPALSPEDQAALDVRKARRMAESKARVDARIEAAMGAMRQAGRGHGG